MFLSALLPAALSLPMVGPWPTAVVAPLLPPSSVQDSDVTSLHSKAPSRLRVEYYTPSKAPVRLLSTSLGQMFVTARNNDARQIVPYLHSFGETLLIQAPEDKMSEVLELIRRTDENYVGEQEQAAHSLEQWSYEVKHISLDSVASALHLIQMEGDPTRAGFSRPPFQTTYVQERGMLICHGSKEQVSRAQAIVHELDVAPKQLMLSCYLLKGADVSSPNLPVDLTGDLSKLVPYKGFEILSSGLLPTDAGSDMSMTVDLDGGMGMFRLNLSPSAYEAQSGKLSLSNVQFYMELVEERVGRGQSRSSRSFETSTSLRRGQYTVLGAVGADPVFLVIRLDEVGS